MTVPRRKTREVSVGNLIIGGDQPIRVQSLTTTKTSDLGSTRAQIGTLLDAGCELIRFARSVSRTVPSGITKFTAPGDMIFEAPEGKIQFRSAKEIEGEAPEIRFRANRLQLVAKNMIEKYENAYRWVSRLFQIRTKRMRTVAEESVHTKAGRIVERAEQDVKITGNKVRLG